MKMAPGFFVRTPQGFFHAVPGSAQRGWVCHKDHPCGRVDAEPYCGYMHVPSMKTVRVRELRYSFSRIEAWLREGEDIRIEKRGQPIGVLRAWRSDDSELPAKPDFAARRRAIWGDRVFTESEVTAMRADEFGGEEGGMSVFHGVHCPARRAGPRLTPHGRIISWPDCVDTRRCEACDGGALQPWPIGTAHSVVPDAVTGMSGTPA